MNNTTRLVLFFSSIALNLVLILLVVSTVSNDDLYAYFNSDCLYLPSIYRDIFIDNNGISGWNFNPAPNFFPDMTCYMILRLFISDLIMASLVYSMIQYAALLLLVYFLFREIVPSNATGHATIANMTITLFLFISLVDHEFEITFHLLSISYHMGAFLMALLCLILTFKYLKRSSNMMLFLIFLLSFLTIISDKLFIVFFSIPVISFILISYKLNIIKLISINILSVITALITFNNLSTLFPISIPGPLRIMNFEYIGESIGMLSGHLWTLLSGVNVMSLILVLSLLSLVLMALMTVRAYRVFRKEKIINSPHGLIFCYSLFSVIFVLVVFLSPVINGGYTGFDSIRYNIYAYYLCLFNYGIIAAYRLPVSVKNKLSISMVGGLLVCSILFTINHDTSEGFRRFTGYYPELARCVDEMAGEHGFKYGVANYWDAKYITMFSRKGVRVYAVFDNLLPYYHVTNQNWFFRKAGKHEEQSIFNFIVMHHIDDEDFSRELFKNSAQRLQCGKFGFLKVNDFRFDRSTLRPVAVN